MNSELEIKLQAFLDGELPESQAREVRNLIQESSDARALLEELTWTKAVLEEGEANVTLPESREFYWSKIEPLAQFIKLICEPVHSL